MALLYNFFRRLGIGAVACFAWVVSTGYFLFLPGRLKTSLRFYRALFPERGLFFRLGCTWRQYHNFASLFAERLVLQSDEDGIQIESEGLEYLEQARAEGTGGVLLMSHVGSWEVAARLLKKKGFEILLYMGSRKRESIEKQQKSDLTAEDIEVVAVENDGGSPFDSLEGLRCLKSGGFVSMSADRLGREEQRTVRVPFLGREVALPKSPYLFATLAKVPLFVFFAVRTGRRRYHLSLTKPLLLLSGSRAEREETMSHGAKQYAALLEAAVRAHPFQWYHFEPFLPDAGIDTVRRT